MWEKLHRAVLQELSRQGLLDCSRACLESVSVRTETGQERDELTDPSSTDGGKKGAEDHVLVTSERPPLAVAITGADDVHRRDPRAV